jgi:hypothetical protein
MNKKNIILLIFSFLLFTVFACESPTDSTVTTALIDPTPGSTGPFTITYNSQLPEIMDKGRSRPFTANTDKKVVWKVEGSSEGSGTVISQNGELFIGEKEANITLTVSATAVDNPDDRNTIEVKVRGWKDISGNLEGKIINGGIGQDNAIGVLAYGVIDGHGRWVLAGADLGSSPGTIYPAIFYSDDNGETWNEARYTNAAHRPGAENSVVSILYDGPEDDKKFVMGTYCADVLWSYDGITWTMSGNIVRQTFPFSDAINPVVYGEVDKDGVSTGMYIAVGLSAEYAWTTDKSWKTNRPIWTKEIIKTNMTLRGEQVVTSTMQIRQFRYGTGVVNGNRVGMFFAQKIALLRPPQSKYQETDRFLYSTDGISWELLATEIIEDGPSWKSPVDEERLAALDFQSAPFPAGNGHIGQLRVTVDTKGDTLFAGDDAYSKQVDLAVVGGDYIMAVGSARRLAIAHKGAYTYTVTE